MRLHDVGGESRTFRVAGADQLVTVGLDWPGTLRDEAELEREALLLGRVAQRVTAPVPEVVSLVTSAGVLMVRELRGRRLIDVASPSESMKAVAAEVMGRTLAELHTWPPDEWADVVPVDTTAPSEWKEEAAEHFGVVAKALDAGQRADVRTFLARPAPEATSDHRFTHNDLGIEHVLVDVQAVHFTGVIDWSDAAITDPAVDVGRLLRDLGPSGLDHAMRAYGDGGGEPDDVLPRAAFYAACGLLEDLAFGLTHTRPEYVDKSMAVWDSVFRTI